MIVNKELTTKERLVRAIKCQEVDRLPWSPFLAYWWEYQPKDVQNKGQISFLQSIEADPLLRGFGSLYDVNAGGHSVKTNQDGNRRTSIYQTKYGILTESYTYAKEADSWFLVEHPVKTQEDFKILTYMMENMSITANMDDFTLMHKDLGEGGLYLPQISPFGKSSFQALIEHYVGTEEMAYAIYDYPQTVEECLAAMNKLSVEAVNIACNSCAEGFIFWEDSSTTNISPNFFDKYAAPEITAWSSIVHSAEKLIVHHACGHIKDLLLPMANTGIDCIESLSPPPTGNVEIWDAKYVLPRNISLIGGIEPTVLLGSTLCELEAYVVNLIEKMGKMGFVLANSDSCPPHVEVEKFKFIGDINRRFNFNK